MASRHHAVLNSEDLTAARPAAAHRPGHGASKAALIVGALGVVFGDIGTSPLYTLKECLHAAGGEHASLADLFGILSLMFWALIFVVTVKYLIFVMRADHDGEGGIFALLAIIPERFRTRAAQSGKVTGMALLAVIGAALLYGDGVITPAISVLSAVEGIEDRQSATGAARAPAHLRHPGRTVRDPAARNGRHRQALRPGDDRLVRHDGGAGHLSHHPEAGDPDRALTAPRGCLFRPPRNPQHAHSRLGRTGGDRR